MEHVWYALSGGVISKSATSNWASKANYIGEAMTDISAQNIVLAHNEAVQAVSSSSEKRSEQAHVNSYQAMKEALEQLLKAEPMQQGERNGYIMGVISQAIDQAKAALALTQKVEVTK
jgi:hypothetical protein